MDPFIKQVIPVTAVIPTANRRQVLQRTLVSLATQSYQPEEIIINDASDKSTNKQDGFEIEGLLSTIRILPSTTKGAAAQRNDGVEVSNNAFILFMDDDIIFEPACIERMWNCIQSEKDAGGVNAMITNQQYHKPGRLTLFMYRLMHGKKLSSYAGKCIGPAWNLLPEDNLNPPEYNEVDWLNTTCTLYKKAALPTPVFRKHFTGYSLMEDLALSLEVGKKWRLLNVRTAKIFHDSQGGAHKNNARAVSKMELVNRHYIMVNIMGRTGFTNHIKLFLLEIFGLATSLRSREGRKNFLSALAGKLQALRNILFVKKNAQ